MSGAEFSPTQIPDVVEIQPRILQDSRGFFMESWNAATYLASGIDATFVQDNHSHSSRGVLRGLHYQIRHVQGKLIRVVQGEVFDVAVDLRRSSPTFGRWVGVWLSAARHNLLWIPPGFAHGFYVTSDSADLLYKCTELYSRGDDRALRWDDPDLAIDWPLGSDKPILSAKDADAIPFREAEVYP